MNWRQCQDVTAELFRSLGCEADVEASVSGARAQHKIDVWVRFKKFGIENRWVVECKHWNSRVTKEKVLVLKAVVDDVGADRGVLISAAGYQSGAIRAVEKTNLTLTDLEGLKETAQEDLLASVVHSMETKVAKLRFEIHGLHSRQQKAPNSWTLEPLQGVNSDLVFKALGKLVVLESGFDDIRLGRTPYLVPSEESGQQAVKVKTVDEFIVRANRVISDVELMLRSQKASSTE